MNYKNVPTGNNIPEDIYAIIEIPAHSYPVKYETDKNSGMLFVDRFISTPMYYPCNYGYINHTLSLDGDPLDVLVPTPYPLQPNSIIHSRPIGMLKMQDDSGEDNKIIAVPTSKICLEYEKIKNITDLPQLLLSQIIHFFQHYKDLEHNKWIKIIGWDNAESAKKEINTSINIK